MYSKNLSYHIACTHNNKRILTYSGKEVPASAVLEMKANFKLPEEGDPWVDELIWIEMKRDQATPLIDKWVRTLIYTHKFLSWDLDRVLKFLMSFLCLFQITCTLSYKLKLLWR